MKHMVFLQKAVSDKIITLKPMLLRPIDLSEDSAGVNKSVEDRLSEACADSLEWNGIEIDSIHLDLETADPGRFENVGIE